MFETMVLATDLSPDWDKILQCAGELKALGCKKVILTHMLVSDGLSEYGAAVDEDAPPRLKAQKQVLEAHGFEVILETPVGSPGRVFNDVARQHGADLILVGSHGKSAWREALLGSISNELLHNARFPILLLNVKRLRTDDRGAVCQLRTTELLRHVLYPTDFSEVAEQGVSILEGLAGRGLAGVTVLHTLEVTKLDPLSVLKTDESPIRSCLEEVADRLRKAGIPDVAIHYSKGHPLSRILEAIGGGDHSMVLMGTQGKSLLSEIFLGSVAYNAARLASCPVLLLPRKQAADNT